MLRLSFLILSVALLISCSGYNPPVNKVTIIDYEANEGTEFRFRNKKKMEVDPKPIGRKKLSDLDGYICLSPEEYLDLKYWVLDVIKEVERKQRLYQCHY